MELPYPNLFAALGLVFGLFYGLQLLLSIAGALKVWLLAKPLKLGVNFRQMGSWAVVTGASDGIGKSYARALARRGCNIVLIARTQSRLQAVADELQRDFPSVKTSCIAIDFTASPEAIRTKARSALEGFEIGTLVNNVGTNYAHPEYLHLMENGDQMCVDMIRCNCMSQTIMTRLVLPQMLERKRGCVLSVSSISGLAPTPLFSVYAGTKAFNDSFSRSLEQEYRSRGIIFQSVRPFGVATKMLKVRKSGFFIPDPDSYVESALSTVGVQPCTHGCLSHALQGLAYRLAPDWLVEKLQFHFVLTSRARCLRKKERVAAEQAKSK